jgi:valyl-tRNA synthetase
MNISILKAGEVRPTGCIVFSVSADANVYFEVNGRIQDARKETEKVKAKLAETRRDQDDIDSLKAELSNVQDKDVAEAMQSAESRKRDVDARLRALDETVTMFEEMMV